MSTSRTLHMVQTPASIPLWFFLCILDSPFWFFTAERKTSTHPTRATQKRQWTKKQATVECCCKVCLWHRPNAILYLTSTTHPHTRYPKRLWAWEWIVVVVSFPLKSESQNNSTNLFKGNDNFICPSFPRRVQIKPYSHIETPKRKTLASPHPLVLHGRVVFPYAPPVCRPRKRKGLGGGCLVSGGCTEVLFSKERIQPLYACPSSTFL